MGESGSVSRLALPGILVLALLAAAFLAAIFLTDTDESAVIALSGQTMGTRYRIVLPNSAMKDEAARNVLETSIRSRLDYLDRGLMSTWSSTSQLTQLNEIGAGERMAIAPEMKQVLDASRQVNELSGGAFDITIKPLVDLWGFGAAGPVISIPAQTDIDKAVSRLGMDKFVLTGGEDDPVVLKIGEITLDLSAVAKGYAVDQVAALLESAGISNYLVEIGGELVVRGKRPDGSFWQVGIESPVEGQSTLFQQIRAGSGRVAVAASGNYRNYFLQDGKRYSHIIDPRTGWPVSHDLVSVTVVAGNTMKADAWATALFVLGPKEGMELANELQLAAYFIVDEAGELKASHSSAFSGYL